MTTAPPKPEGSFQGIPKAVFIENVDEYIKAKAEPYDVVFAELSQQFTSYKKLEARFTTQRDNLKSKIPEIETTLESIEHIKATSGTPDRECEYELSSGTFGTATIADTNNVYLWIGANLLVEYTIEEALKLLVENSETAKSKVEYFESGIRFLQEQIVVMQDQALADAAVKAYSASSATQLFIFTPFYTVGKPDSAMSHGTRSHAPNLGDTVIAGALSGMFSASMTYPFEIIKTRLHFELVHSKVDLNAPQTQIREIIRRIWSEGLLRPQLGSPVLGGILGFYRGLDQLIPEAALKVLLRFLAFHQIQHLYAKHILGSPDAQLSFGSNLLCGSLAGALEAALIVQPFERGKTLRADFHSPYTVYADSFRQHGPLGGLKVLYTGFVPCLARQVCNQATGLSLFYSLKNCSGKRDLNTVERLGFGFLGGLGGAVLTMPMDVTKSIAQKQQGITTMSTMQIVRDVLKKRGIRGFYTGLLPRLGRVGLDRAFGFLAFEWTMEKLALARR